MEILVLLLLILFNGLFAMSEMAIVASRRVRLMQASRSGDRLASAALLLAEHPTRFLSTVQVGITMIGIFAGAFGEAAIARDFEAWLARFPALAPYSRAIAFAVVALSITFLSLVVGELVPKRIALSSPERVARIIAPPMTLLSRLAAPFVYLLSLATDVIVRLLGVRRVTDHAVSEEEVKGLIEQGAQTGVFHETEEELVMRVFRLADRQVGELMVPRLDIDWLPADATVERVRVAVATSSHSHFPVCEGGLDRVVGVVHVKDLVKHGLITDEVNVRALARPPIFVPETMPALSALEMFRTKGMHIAFVLDEYGSLEGLITLNDIVQGVFGEVARADEAQEPLEVRRRDGSWLLDGMLPVDRLKELLEVMELPEEEAGYQTLGGMLMTCLGRVPQAGDEYRWREFRFEVVDMDRRRVDKVMVGRVGGAGDSTESSDQPRTTKDDR